jgi:hypothetical protein
VLGSGRVDLAQQIARVDRLDPRERRRRFLGFVRLQMADQVPTRAERRERVDLRGRSLDAVFAEGALAGVDRSADDVVAKGLGNGDQSD